jgi:hypothetical protein
LAILLTSFLPIEVTPGTFVEIVLIVLSIVKVLCGIEKIDFCGSRLLQRLIGDVVSKVV